MDVSPSISSLYIIIVVDNMPLLYRSACIHIIIYTCKTLGTNTIWWWYCVAVQTQGMGVKMRVLFYINIVDPDTSTGVALLLYFFSTVVLYRFVPNSIFQANRTGKKTCTGVIIIKFGTTSREKRQMEWYSRDHSHV